MGRSSSGGALMPETETPSSEWSAANRILEILSIVLQVRRNPEPVLGPWAEVFTKRFAGYTDVQLAKGVITPNAVARILLGVQADVQRFRQDCADAGQQTRGTANLFAMLEHLFSLDRVGDQWGEVTSKVDKYINTLEHLAGTLPGTETKVPATDLQGLLETATRLEEELKQGTYSKPARTFLQEIVSRVRRAVYAYPVSGAAAFGREIAEWQLEVAPLRTTPSTEEERGYDLGESLLSGMTRAWKAARPKVITFFAIIGAADSSLSLLGRMIPDRPETPVIERPAIPPASPSTPPPTSPRLKPGTPT